MGYTETQAKAFIEHIAPLMVAEGSRRGYSIISTAIAQAIIEGACGTSGLAKYHNHWGLKCGSSWKGASVNMKTKEEYTVGTLTTIKDNFRAYASDPEGVAGYYDFISSKRYANLKSAKNYREYAEYLKADGYATSSSYVNTLCNTVLKYGLEKYDKNAYPVYPTLKEGSTGDYVKLLQRKLGLAEKDVTGVFDSVTKEIVKTYQKSQGLIPDGIVGKLTWSKLLNM